MFDLKSRIDYQSLQEAPLMLAVCVRTWKKSGNPAFYLSFYFFIKLYDNFQSTYWD